MRGEAEAAHGFLDAPLVAEVRDARPLVRGSHGCVNEVFDAGLARQRRKTLALRLFSLDARLPRVLHAENAPRAGRDWTTNHHHPTEQLLRLLAPRARPLRTLRYCPGPLDGFCGGTDDSDHHVREGEYGDVEYGA